jgi:hypothetical protein
LLFLPVKRGRTHCQGEFLAITALFIRRTVCCLFLLQLDGFFWFPIDTEMVDFQPISHNFQEFMPC